MGRVMAVDWGKRRIGMAVSDETRIIARPLPTLEITSRREALRRVIAVAVENGASTILIGHPLHMEGGEGESAREARAMAEEIAARLPEVAVRLADERLTSREASKVLQEHGERRRREKGRLDQVAAAILLQSYLDAGAP
jgi:putative Holliday junction resolvase